LGRRIIEKEKVLVVEYLCRWEGYPKYPDTWQPAENFNKRLLQAARQQFPGEDPGADESDDVWHFEPKTASYENVKGLLMAKNIWNLKKMIAELHCMGYQLRLAKLNSSDYGDPQKRERVILWGAQASMHLPMKPQHTHGKNQDYVWGDLLFSISDHLLDDRGHT
jgi:hypothetical protein